MKCVSLDTGSIPPEINPWAPRPLNPHPAQSLHPPCLLKCVCLGVCVLVFTLDEGSACPVSQHSQGATEKTAVCLRETENVREREWRANRHASQDRHFWSEYHHLCCSPSPLLTSSLFLSLSVSLHIISSYLYASLPLLFYRCLFPAMFFACCKNLRLHFPQM